MNNNKATIRKAEKELGRALQALYQARLVNSPTYGRYTRKLKASTARGVISFARGYLSFEIKGKY